MYFLSIVSYGNVAFYSFYTLKFVFLNELVKVYFFETTLIYYLFSHNNNVIKEAHNGFQHFSSS